MLKKTNPKIDKNLMQLNGGILELLLALGYIEVIK